MRPPLSSRIRSPASGDTGVARDEPAIAMIAAVAHSMAK